MAYRRVVVLIMAASLLELAPAAAEPILSTGAFAFPGFFSGLPTVQDTDTTNSGGPVESSVDFSTTGFSGNAAAVASFGSLGASAHVTLDDYLPMSFSHPCEFNPSVTCSNHPAVGHAGFADVLTINTGLGSGFLEMTFDIGGTSSLTHDFILTGPGAQGTLTVGPSFAGPFYLTIGFDESLPNQTALIPFIDGTAFPIAVRLSAFIVPFDLAIVGATYDLDGTADFLNTANLTGFRVFADEARTQEITSFSVTAESGTNYAPVATEVPEPASLLLLAVGMASGAAVRRRRKASARR